jgi:hypothetical protein
MSSKVNKTLKTVLRQDETTLNEKSLAKRLDGDGIELLVDETKVGKARVVSMVDDQLLQLSRETVEGGWRTLTGVRVVTTGSVRDHAVVSHGGCVLDVFTRRNHLEVRSHGKRRQTHVLEDCQKKEVRRRWLSVLTMSDAERKPSIVLVVAASG